MPRSTHLRRRRSLTSIPLSISFRSLPLVLAVVLLAQIFAPRLASASGTGTARTHVTVYTLPAEVRSTHFRVRINGHPADVLHAASNYYLLNSSIDGPVIISVTAEDPHFWDRGVEVQPMRLGIRPHRHGATITFPLASPDKVVVARPGDHFADADMLFLFANPPEIRPDLRKVRYFGPGLHRENIDLQSGQHVYLDGGAVILGALNIWQVHNARVSGPGTIIYDGPQNPHADEGWMHKRNWHCIVMDQAENIEIDGITCVTRSRTWQVQMLDSHHIGLFNIKIVGGNPNNANQDGLDWLGGGDTTVRNSFFRASDDVFALQGNWEGYEPELLRLPGHDVRNITIEDTVTSTSISNTVRVGWPEKTFNSAHFHMRSVDVLHTGFGACKVPFAFFELWADPDGHGRHEDYTFNDIRLEDWYSLLQIRQPAPLVTGVRFSSIWAMESPAMLPPVLRGDVHDVDMTGTTLQGFTPAALQQELQAKPPTIYPGPLQASFSYTAGRLRRRQPIVFTAAAATATSGPASFEWLFGDGTRGRGQEVTHRFADSRGTLLDGSGRFRVLLHVTTPDGHDAWSSQNLVLATPPYRQPGSPASLTPPERRSDTTVDIPRTGGYTVTLLTSTQATMAIDDLPASHSPAPRPEVCGTPGDAVQPVRLSVVLEKGTHHIHVAQDSSLENAAVPPGSAALLLLEGPDVPRTVIR